MAFSTFGWVQSDLGAGHYMRTMATVNDNRWCLANTRIFTVTKFGGYNGSVVLQVVDANGFILDVSPKMGPWGVDGRWVGVSDRTIAWNHQFDPNKNWDGAVRIVPFMFWDPTWKLWSMLLQAGKKALGV